MTTGPAVQVSNARDPVPIPESAFATGSTPSICFVGLRNLPVLAKEYSHYGVGGAQLQQTLLAKALVRRRYRVSMVVADYGQPDGAVWDGITTYKTYRLDAGIPILRFFHPRWTGVWSAMRRANSEIYYVSCADMLLGEAVLFARVHRRKAVFRVASDSDCHPDQLLIRYRRDKELYVYGLRRADAVLAQTAAQQQALLDRFGRPSRIVPSLAAVSGIARQFHDRDIDVLWVGTIRQLKRSDLTLELAARLPGLAFHLVGGPFEQEPSLFDQVRERASLLKNVCFHGPVPYQDIGSYYGRAKVLLNTSDIEGFPNTYLQAWAHGTPVVAFHDPNGVIDREHLGTAVNNMDEMRDAISAFTTDQSMWTVTSSKCREFVTREYDEDSRLAPYLEVFRSLIPQGHRA